MPVSSVSPRQVRPFHVSLRAAIFIASALGAGRSAIAEPSTQPAVPDYTTCTQSYKLPFSHPVDFENLKGLHVRVSINGGPAMSLQVDTGSVGIIVGASDVPNIDPNAPAGSITYSSSGVELIGVWTPATITFLDAKDADGNVATAVIPILAATESRLHPGAVNSGTRPATTQPRPDPHPHMMGMGFGRGKEPHPERNPFVNLKEMEAGTMRRGYTITRDGITLGLASKDVGPGYLFQKLIERDVSADTKTMKPGLKDWATARGSISVDGQNQPDAAVLLDTGLTNMMIGSSTVTEHADVAAGTPITVNLLGGQLHYSFVVGDTKNPVAPRRVTWVSPPTGSATLNTGLRALASFDYLYDADGGYLGLRPTRKSE